MIEGKELIVSPKNGKRKIGSPRSKNTTECVPEPEKEEKKNQDVFDLKELVKQYRPKVYVKDMNPSVLQYMATKGYSLRQMAKVLQSTKDTVKNALVKYGINPIADKVFQILDVDMLGSNYRRIIELASTKDRLEKMSDKDLKLWADHTNYAYNLRSNKPTAIHREQRDYTQMEAQEAVKSYNILIQECNLIKVEKK